MMKAKQNLNLFLLLIILLPTPLMARTIEPYYEDPFDIAAGGTSLTKATQEAMLVSNPAQLPLGGKFFRWLGIKTTLAPGAQSLDLLQNQGKTEEDQSSSEFVDGLFNKPLHLGATQSVSLITANFGLAAFVSATPDIKAWRRGDPQQGAGTPNVVVQNEAYGGIYASVASFTSRWLSLGLTAKYLKVNELRETVELTDQDAVNALQKKGLEESLSRLDTGRGFDFGSLIFFQGKYIDFSLANVLQNIGSMHFSGITPPAKQMYHTGASLIFHTSMDAIILAMEYRDVLNANEQPDFKRYYIGSKYLLRTYLGLAAGIYHGAPTYGAEVDLILLRLAASVYTREYGNNPGVDPRKIYMVSISTGLTL